MVSQVVSSGIFSETFPPQIPLEIFLRILQRFRQEIPSEFSQCMVRETSSRKSCRSFKDFYSRASVAGLFLETPILPAVLLQRFCKGYL